jgi:GT2 family glycosyltransferase
MSAIPDLSIIVVTHKGGGLALQALRTSRTHLGPVDAEWIVVDSGSDDGTPDLIESTFPELPVERLPNVGFAAANNAALARARGRYVLLLNPDMEIRSGTLAELVTAMDERPEVGVLSVVQTWPDGEIQHTIRRFPSPARQLGEALCLTGLPGLSRLSEEEQRDEQYRHEIAADWLVGGFLLVRREAVADAGGLDERFFLYSEETDWCYRLRAAGWDIRHVPLMTVVHHCGRMARPDLFAQNSHSKLLYAAKHFSRRRRAAFRAALAVRHAVRFAFIGAAAVGRRDLRGRATAERRALATVLGIAPPPFRPVAAGVAG